MSLRLCPVLPSGWGPSATALFITALIIGWSDLAAAADIFSPIGPVMEEQSTHLLRAGLIALVAILPAILLLPIMLWRYRIGGKARYRPEWEFNKWYEMTIWGIPTLVICVLAYWLAESTFKYDPYTPLGEDPLEIDLVGMDFRFLAIYPDQGVTALDQIVIPTNRPVTFRLTSDTNMQSFLPNGFAGQIYLMPGMVTQLNLAANREGEGTATQTQFNGHGFANMRVTMRAVSDAQFDAWVDSAAGEPLNAESYGQLVVSGESAQEYHPATPELRPLTDTCLFDRVVARYHQGAAIPPEAQPGSTVFDPAQGTLPAAPCDTLLANSHFKMSQMDNIHHDPAGSNQ